VARIVSGLESAYDTCRPYEDKKKGKKKGESKHALREKKKGKERDREMRGLTQQFMALGYIFAPKGEGGKGKGEKEKARHHLLR